VVGEAFRRNSQIKEFLTFVDDKIEVEDLLVNG